MAKRCQRRRSREKEEEEEASGERSEDLIEKGGERPSITQPAALRRRRSRHEQ